MSTLTEAALEAYREEQAQQERDRLTRQERDRDRAVEAMLEAIRTNLGPEWRPHRGAISVDTADPMTARVTLDELELAYRQGQLFLVAVADDPQAWLEVSSLADLGEWLEARRRAEAAKPAADQRKRSTRKAAA